MICPWVASRVECAQSPTSQKTRAATRLRVHPAVDPHSTGCSVLLHIKGGRNCIYPRESERCREGEALARPPSPPLPTTTKTLHSLSSTIYQNTPGPVFAVPVMTGASVFAPPRLHPAPISSCRFNDEARDARESWWHVANLVTREF